MSGILPVALSECVRACVCVCACVSAARPRRYKKVIWGRRLAVSRHHTLPVPAGSRGTGRRAGGGPGGAGGLLVAFGAEGEVASRCGTSWERHKKERTHFEEEESAMLPPPPPAFLQLLVFTLTLTPPSSAAAKSHPRYELRHSPLPFERAQEACHPHGLASFARPEELAQVLSLIGGSPRAGSLTFWVGLKKAKNQCVVPSLPLRGFKWTFGGEDATESRWAHEPEQTCTSVLCAGLVTQLDGSTVVSWGLVPLSCKTRNHFICKLESDDGGLAEPKLGRTEPAGPKTAEPEFPTPEPAGPNQSEQKPEVPQLPTPEPAGPEKVRPESATPEPAVPELPERKPHTPTPPTPEAAGPELVGPESTRPGPDEAGSDIGPESGSGSCPHPVVAGARFLTLDPDNSSRIQVDCWSKVRVDLHCWAPAAGWRLPGGAPANLSSVCTPCGAGFRKDTSGECADVDECSGPHGCPRQCVNTAGSFTCVCGEDGTACKPTESDAPGPFSGVLVPALVGAAVVLLVLALIAGVTIWCCLRQRNKKKEAEQRDKLAH
ncbi:C-type lectin domain family 14 member A [Vanacampus margaritifer]